MALAMKCKNGHSYIQADVYHDWPKGVPHCPQCAADRKDIRLKITEKEETENANTSGN